MRKLGLLLILFLVVGVFAFAADMTVEERVAALESNSAIVPAVEASATLTFGMDLNTNYVGFKNEGTADVKITWYDDATVSTGGDGWHGYIEVNDIYFSLTGNVSPTQDADTSPFAFSGDNGTDVVAKITNDTIYATVYGAPGNDIEDVSGVDAAAFNGADSTLAVASPAYPSFAAANSVQGTTIGYTSGMISDLSLGLVSDGDWTANTANDFGVRVNADIVPMDLLEVNVHVLYGMFQNAGATLGFGLQPIITVSSIMSGLTVTLGFDGASAAAFTWDASAGIALNLAAENSDGDQDNAALKVYYSSGQTDLSFAVSTFTNAGMIDGVGFTTTFTLTNLTGTMGWGVDVSAAYDKGGINPYAELYLDSASVTGVKVGVALGSDLHQIENTTFTLQYLTANVSSDKGLVTLATKIEM